MKFKRSLLASALFLATSTTAFATCPSGILSGACGNGIYAYPGYYDAAPGAHVWTDWINNYNAGATDPANKISIIYAYASDLEFPNCTVGNGNSNDFNDKATWGTTSFNITSRYQIPKSSTTGSASINCELTNNKNPISFDSTKANNPPSTKVTNPTYVPYYFYGSTFDQATSIFLTSTKDQGSWKNEKATPNTATSIQTYLNTTCLAGTSCSANSQDKLKIVALVDGRIDNGYLQGFNTLTDSQARANAHFIAYGTTNLLSKTSDKIPYDSNYTNSYTIQGICNDPNVIGVQMDLEPFAIADGASTTSGGQASFYDQLGKDLNSCGKFYSVFTFPSKMTQSAINILTGNGSRDNFYAVYSLYDLEGTSNPAGGDSSATDAPILVGMNSSNQFTACYNNGSSMDPNSPLNAPKSADPSCAGAFGSSAPVPHSSANYLINVTNELNYIKNNPNTAGAVPFKLAIPAAASAHEFESWYTRASGFNFTPCAVNPVGDSAGNLIPWPVNVGCPAPGAGTMGNLIGTNKTNKQLDYVQAALSAISSTGINTNANLLGIDLWGLSDAMEWSPNNAIVDNLTGYSTGGTYVFFTPSTPPANVISYLQNNLVDKTGVSISNLQVVGKPTANSYILSWTLNCTTAPSSGFSAVSQLYAQGNNSPLSRSSVWIDTPTCGKTYQSTYTPSKGSLSTTVKADLVLEQSGTFQYLTQPSYIPITFPASKP